MLVFNDNDFAAAVTDQPDPAENSDDPIATTSSALVENASSTAVNTTPACINKTAEISNLVSDMQASPVGLPSSSFYSEKKKIVVTVTDINPLPKRIRSMNPGTKRRKSSSATILTSSPHKNTLNTRNSDVTKRKRGDARKTKQKRGRKTENKQNSICLVCGDSAHEDWIQCKNYKEWAHKECADIRDSKFCYCDNLSIKRSVFVSNNVMRSQDSDSSQSFLEARGKKGILPVIRMGKYYRIFTHFNGRKADESGAIAIVAPLPQTNSKLDVAFLRRPKALCRADGGPLLKADTINLPIGSFEDFDRVEPLLEDITSECSSTIGGITGKVVISTILSKLLTSELATSFNWMGSQKWNAFITTRKSCYRI
ncbi:unnamed protein product [Clavelina lepadiformis]|uniref:DUF4806 domain-containing protein n=1 Tax=Clavelina lepadiformis TaxID=159417 RepID=A0ABP0G5B1_CLALP